VRRALPLLVAVLALAGCGGGSTTTSGTTTATAPTTPTTTSPTTTTSSTIALRAYFLGPARKVQPVSRTVPATPALGRAAVEQLFAGPSAVEQLATSIPSDTKLLGLTIQDGVASVRLSRDLPRAAQAQLVYTLTQFPTVDSVSIGGGAKVTRSDYEDETPQILVETPLRDATVASPIRVAGTANTFEATFEADILDASGTAVATKVVTATSGSGERGTYDVKIPVDTPPGKITLVVFEPSAKDGSPLHRVEVPLTLARG
jgi:hypothetical protein